MPEPDGDSPEPDVLSPDSLDSDGDSPDSPESDAPPTDFPESESPEPDVAELTRLAEHDEWCLPELAGDTVRLFWCEDDLWTSPDVEVYERDGVPPTYRTRPLVLEVGTRVERYSTCTGLNAVEEVVGFVELPATADGVPLLGVHLCGRFFLGEELYSWGLGLYRAWQDAEGDYQVEMPDPIEYLATC